MFTGENLTGSFHIPVLFDIIAIILFAITGALSAATREYDWIGVMAIAFVTGCGGGLIRDILLNQRPVILENEHYLWGVIIAVILSVIFCQQLAKIRWIFVTADALGLAMYAVIGTQKSLSSGLGPTAAILIGTLNAIGGGIIRDVLTREEAAILKPGQYYAVIAFIASVMFCTLSKFSDLQWAAAGVLTVFTAVILRVIALRYDLKTRPLKPRGFEASNNWWV